MIRTKHFIKSGLFFALLITCCFYFLQSFSLEHFFTPLFVSASDISSFTSKDDIINRFSNSFYSYWIGGSNLINDYDSFNSLTYYNQKAVISARAASAIWTINTDTTSLMIVFGGLVYIDSTYYYLNDMYKSEDNGITWYWIYGCNEYDNQGSYPLLYGNIAIPSSRNYPCYWSIGEYLYLYGGNRPTGYLSDLLKMPISSIINDNPTFYWIAGCDTGNYAGSYTSYDTLGSSIPRNRYGAMTWIKYDEATDTDTVFIYGGFGEGTPSAGHLSDIFSYNIKNESLFTWIGGCNFPNAPVGSYPSSYNQTGIPHSRSNGITWYNQNIISTGIVYLFGGINDQIGTFNDLWISYDDGRVWYWMNGCNEPYDQGRYDTNNIFNSYPSSRSHFSSFINNINTTSTSITSSYAIFYGGYTQISSLSTPFSLSDWWLFDFDTFNFTLLRGNNDYDSPGTYLSTYNQVGTIGALDSYSMVYYNNFIYILFGAGLASNSSSYGNINSIWRIQFYEPHLTETSNTMDIILIFIALFSISFLLISVFSIIKSDFFNPSSVFFLKIKDKLFIAVITIIGLLNFISDILFIFVFMLPNFIISADDENNQSKTILIIFSISLFILILSIILNFTRIRSWFSDNLAKSNFKSEKQYDSLYYKLTLIYHLSVIINPSLLYISKLFPLNLLDQQKESNQSNTVNYLCFLYDLYSIIPQSILLYYYSFAVDNINDWDLLLYIIILFKFTNQMIMISRIIFTLYLGGGASNIKRLTKLEYGIYKTVRTTPVPKLIDTSTLSVIELSQDSPSTSCSYTSTSSSFTSNSNET